MNQTIIQFIIEELNQGKTGIELSPDEDLLTGGLVESMSMLQLILFLENTYSIKIPPQDMTIENFRSVEAMVCYIQKRKN